MTYRSGSGFAKYVARSLTVLLLAVLAVAPVLRMLAVFEPLRPSLADSSLSVDQLARILNSRIHTSRREV